MSEINRKYNVIDLFAGAGGLSEGFIETGKFDFLAHVEWEKPMVDTLRNNLEKRWNYSQEEATRRVIRFDIQKTDELMNGSWSDETRSVYEKDNSPLIACSGMDGMISEENVDVIIGGPPCQAYSIAGRAQDPNSMKDDYRNYLFESFVKVVDHYRPKLFVFENVPGILSACPGDQPVIERIYNAFMNIGYKIRKPEEMKNSVYSAAGFGVPQDRRRVIIFGVEENANIELEDLYTTLRNLESDKKTTVRDAIGGLAELKPLEKTYKEGNRNVSHKMIGEEMLTQHDPRYINPRDQKIYQEWIEKDMNKIPNEEKLEYYHLKTGKTTNHNKYRSLEWDKPSPTIVSHLYKDGHMFIHPDPKQARSITVREAALLQSFPADFEFVGSTAYCYKMIGNAVPVLFAKKIGEAVDTVLRNTQEVV